MWSSTVLRALWKPALLLTILMVLISVYDTARMVRLCCCTLYGQIECSYDYKIHCCVYVVCMF